MRRLLLVVVAAVLVLGSGALAVAQEGTPTTEDGGEETPCPAAMGTPGASPEATEAGAAMAAGESSPAASPSAEQECHVDIEDFAFGPAAIEIDAGTTVVWENYDSAAHTVTADDGSFDSGEVTQGQTFSQTFDTPGTFTYHCAIHPNMTGTITVR